MNDYNPFDTPAWQEACRDYQAEAARRADPQRSTSTRAPLRQVHPPMDSTPAGCDDVPLTPLDAYGDMGEPARGEAGEAKGERKSCFRSAASLKGKPVPEREWNVRDIVPGRNVTLLSGDGAAGKSLLSLQLCASTVIGSNWLGRPVKQGRALFISAEDDEDELHRRLNDILAAEGCDWDAIEGLTYRSLAGEDALLAIEGQLSLIKSELFKELESRAEQESPVLIVIDTLADVYPANENDRAKVRQFVGILRGLAIRQKCAVILLGHPSLTGINSGSGTSGSTAWNNSVRSRLYMTRVQDEAGHEPDTCKRILTNKKNNYGPTGFEIGMTWREGVFHPDADETSLDRMAASAKAERVFLKLLRSFNEQNRFVSPNPSNAYAPSVFAKHPEREGVTKAAFHAAMERLLGKNAILIAMHGRGASQKQHLEAAQ